MFAYSIINIISTLCIHFFTKLNHLTTVLRSQQSMKINIFVANLANRNSVLKQFNRWRGTQLVICKRESEWQKFNPAKKSYETKLETEEHFKQM